ncbi:acyl-CoA dehydrogenase family protein [Adonisia turfae]|uniref:Acyl-CoA dehydrogenase n=1 Tax=Adonisia turfae CCMR0081 TaxID=2292702 RepID=A0A6M0RSG4_9CYAN|nr:acyl-CoA dehydrogenase family protein [Adonisia turfae]NEZ58661.1 acyl-CoA dehydrogenase [Adonisia turfae CCMR0081]
MSTLTVPRLNDELLNRCAERAATYDRENRFCQEDFDELKAAGYLLLTVPPEFGGKGLTLAEMAKETRRLAYHAPATAVCLNMHHYWVGLAADLYRSGDHSTDWILERAAQGDVFAAGHAESGNDIPLLYSTTTATHVKGGYRFQGRKSFGSLTPVWDWLGIHGMDASDPDHPKIVHAFMHRDTAGYHIKQTWDVLGMRATRSDDTILEDVFIPDNYVSRVVPAGFGGADYFVLCVFAWALMGFANVYYAIAQRALDLTLEAAKKKTSIALQHPMSHHAEIQHGIADMILELDTIGPHIEKIAEDWSNGVDHGGQWPEKLVSAKYHAVESSWQIVDRALDLSGGFGMFKKSELERLFRDARAGRFHPANSALTHEIVAKIGLGINLDEQPRWG